MKLILSVWFSIALVVGCNPDKDSGTKAVGDLMGPHQQCTKEPSRYPEALSYIEDLAKHLMEKNGDVFTGRYDPNQFCFFVAGPKDLVNATAYPDRRTIVFYPGQILSMTNDAQVAAVVAHELAHVLLNHTGGLSHDSLRDVGRVMPPVYEQFMASTRQLIDQDARYQELQTFKSQVVEGLRANDPQAAQVLREIDALEAIAHQNAGLENENPANWSKLKEQMASQYDKLRTLEADPENANAAASIFELITSYEQNLKGLYQKQAELVQQLTKGASDVLSSEEIANGPEREADELGLKLYIRAGFKPSEFSAFILNYTVKNDIKNATNSMLKCLSSMLTGSIERGSGSHPSGCWRHYNLSVSQTLKLYNEDTAQFLAARSTHIFEPARLSEVKSKIHEGPQDIVREPYIPPQTDPVGEKEACDASGGIWRVGPAVCDLITDIEKEKQACIDDGGAWHTQCAFCYLPDQSTVNESCQVNWNDDNF